MAKVKPSPWWGFDAFYRLTGGKAWNQCMANRDDWCGPHTY
ncbi:MULTISPECIES: hypothetical protein [Mammaliicoccus]|nr:MULTISPECIES: hypothetical protein [Mammaliicoccus]